MQSPLSIRILVVHGNETARQVIVKVLQQAGHTVCEADTALEALELAVAAEPALICLGVELPDMDGREVCRRLKSHPKTASTPVIHIAASYTSGEDRVLGLEMGAEAYLSEPVDPKELLAYVRSMLRVHHAEAALRTSEQKFRSIFETSNEGIWILNGEARVTLVNPRMAELLGYTEAQMLGQTKFDFVFPEERERVWQHFEKRKQGLSEQFELRFRHCDGRPVWMLVSARPMFTNGKFTGVLDMMTDITERKQDEEILQQAKEQLARANEALERKVQERTAKLTDTVHELESWSYSIAHDMRAPLRSMQSFAQMLRDKSYHLLDATCQDYLRRIIVAADRMDQFILDLLNYSHVARAELNLVPVDVAELISDIVGTYPNLHPDKAEIKVCRPLPKLLANTPALTQVISNLLGNAVKFVPPGVFPRVSVYAQERGDWARLWFSDNGIGIPEKSQETIFKIFQRLNPPTRYEGTGIGLAIVQKAVLRMGGTVGVESEVGKGSRFWIQLKRAVSEPPVPELSTPPPPHKTLAFACHDRHC